MTHFFVLLATIRVLVPLTVPGMYEVLVPVVQCVEYHPTGSKAQLGTQSHCHRFRKPKQGTRSLQPSHSVKVHEIRVVYPYNYFPSEPIRKMALPLSSKSLLLASSVFIASFVIAAKFAPSVWKRDDSSSDTKDHDDSTSTEGDDSKSFENRVPTHVQRLLYKEKRRKDSVRFLAMKKPMYDNIEMFSPDDVLLCTISKKKAAWYIRKNLASWKKESKSIQLMFEPQSKPSEANTYNRSHKKNICVVCGDSENFMRHYVVPYCYRTLFPIKYKTHTPHDIVLMCPDCHVHSEQATQRRQKELEASLRSDPGTANPNIPDRNLRNIKNVASALSTRRDQIPQEKVEEYEILIKRHFGLDSSAWLSKELLLEATTMETSFPNPSHIAGPLVVISTVANDEKSIKNFIIEWRNHFVETMQPRFLPVGWSVDSPVHND
jgi:hypothetical protein